MGRGTPEKNFKKISNNKKIPLDILGNFSKFQKNPYFMEISVLFFFEPFPKLTIYEFQLNISINNDI